MRNRPLQVFVSSRMEELQPERAALRAALADLRVEAFVFETDAGARPHSIQQTYLEEVEEAELYIGVFWTGYGAHTIAEFEHASSLGIDCLIYEKRTDAPDGRDPALREFLARLGEVEDGLTIRRFDSADELAQAVKEDVAGWLARRHREGSRTPPAVFHGVPSRPPSSFIGRQTEIARMARALRSGKDLAIEGPPGVGKTTLAIALVHHPGIIRHFRDGVLWASLGPRADAADALAGWAQALGRAGIVVEDITRLPRLADRTQAVRDGIGLRRMLLVIDDVWESEAGDLLRCGGPNCALAITTRDRQIAHAFAGGSRAEPLAALQEDDACRLLALLAPEACEADPDGARGLVRAVGCLPQAVRLIGGYLARPGASMFGDLFAGLATTAFEEMADPRKRLQLAEQRLGAGTKTTLEETILLSLHDLPPEARQAFSGLGAFAAKPERFTPEAAAAVTASGASSLALLAARNLLEVDAASRLLSLHPTIADVARMGLEPESVARHREHYLEVIRASGDVSSIASVYGQLRWAWRQAPDDDTLFVLLGALVPFQQHRGLSADTLAWAERTLAVARARDLVPVVGRLLAIMGDAAKALGTYEKAVEHYLHELSIWESIGEPTWQADALVRIGYTLGKLGRHDEGLARTAAARALAEAAGDRGRRAEVLLVTAILLRDANRRASALALAEEALAELREVREPVRVADCLAVLAVLHRDLGHHERALEYVRALMDRQADIGSPSADAEARLLFASVTSARGELEEALVTAREACAKAEASGPHHLFTDSLGLLGDLLVKLDRFDEAHTCYGRQLAVHDERGDRAGRAQVLRAVAFAFRRQGRHADALAASEEALRITREMGNPLQQAHALEGLHQATLQQEPDRALACLREALGIYRGLGDRRAQALVLGDLAQLRWTLEEYDGALEAYGQADALFRDTADWSRHDDAPRRADGTGVSTAGAAGADSSRQSSDAAADARDPRERHRRYEARFGPALRSRHPMVPPLVLALGWVLSRWVGGAALRPHLLDAIDRERHAIATSLGVPPPAVILADRRPDVGPDSYVIEVDSIPLVTGTLREEERLFPGSLDELSASGVLGRSAVDPSSGRQAAWVARQDWSLVEGLGRPLWTGTEYIARRLGSVMRTHLHLFHGHQRTMEMIEAHVPEAAGAFSRDAALLGALVLVLGNLLEEGAPLVPFRPIVETFLTLRAAGRERLEILRAARLLPGIREQLPGNTRSGSLAPLPADVEREIEASIQTIDSIPFLAMEPERTRQLLAMVRQHAGGSALAGIVVANPLIRRYVRKVVELEFPSLPVISREELAPGREAAVSTGTAPSTV